MPPDTLPLPDPQLTEIDGTAGALPTRLSGLEIARGLLGGDDTLARAMDAALLQFGLLDLARRDDGEQPGSLGDLCGVLGAGAIRAGGPLFAVARPHAPDLSFNSIQTGVMGRFVAL